MSQPFVRGPVFIFFTFGPGSAQPGTTRFFGLTAGGVSIQEQNVFQDYHVDMAGVPLDKSFQGTTAVVSGSFTRWNEDTFNLIRDKAGNAGGAGVFTSGQIGTLLDFEGTALKLCLVFPYSLKAAFAAAPRGYRYLAAVLDRESLPEQGVKPARLDLSFTCWPHLDLSAATQAIYGPGKMTLWDEDVSAASFSMIS